MFFLKEGYMTKKIPAMSLNKTNWFNRGTGGALFFCVLLLFSCDFPGAPLDGQSYLTINLPGTREARSGLARSVLSDADTGSLEYKVRFTGSGGTLIERTVAGGSISLTLSPGTWSIMAEAYDPPGVIGGTLAGTGTATVTVVSGQHQNVTIPMYVDPAYEAGLTDIYIHNETELRRIGTDFAIDGSISFYLERDITLTQPWTPIGDGAAPFKAVFDGQGYRITVNSLSGAKNGSGNVLLGFFASVEDAEIKDLTIQYNLGGPVDMSTGDGVTYGYGYAGGIAGKAVTADFKNIRVTGNFSIIFDGIISLYVGGIAGGFIDGTIDGSSFTGTIGAAAGDCKTGGIAGIMTGDITASYVSARVQGQGTAVYAGGIAGSLSGGASIEGCYAWAEVRGDGSLTVMAGGIAGGNYDTIRNCYARGTVLGENGSTLNYAGGIAGANSSGTITSCAALNDSISFSASSNVHGITGGQVSGGTYTDNYAASDIAFTRASSSTNPNFIGTATYGRADFINGGSFDWTALLSLDFVNDWKWLSGYPYPALAWQTTPPPDPSTL
jgi:hypothetical protein